MVNIIHIENNEEPVKRAEKLIKKIRLRTAGPVNFFSVVNPAHDDKTILQAAKDHKPDLAIIDLLLRDDGAYDGIEAARCIKAQDPTIKVLLFSVKRKQPAALADQVTRDTIYDAYVHKFGSIYVPGADPIVVQGIDDVEDAEDVVDLVFRPIVFLRAVKYLLERGVIPPSDWEAPEVGDR